MLVSGGVDSTVCAALLRKSLKEEQVIAVHIDNGFMRKQESQKVEESLKKIGLKLKGNTLFLHLLKRIGLKLKDIEYFMHLLKEIGMKLKGNTLFYAFPEED